MAKPRKPKNEEQKPDNNNKNNNSIAVVQHQKLCLSIDMENQRIYGYTELKVIVPESGLVGLHADNMIIESVLVDGEKTEFHFVPHFQLIDDDGGDDARRFSSVSSTHSAADAASSSYVSSLEMELVPNLLILCSKEVKPGDNEQHKFESVDNEQQKVEENAAEKNVENGSQTIVENGVHANGENVSQTNQENGSQSSGEVKQNVKLIRIDYWIEKAETGIHFDCNVLHTDNQIRRAQCWFPCMNNSSQRYCFDMEFTVAQNFVAVSNGTLLYQVLSKDDPPRKTFVYSLSVPVAARWISLVVAQFEILVDSHNGIISHMCLSPDILKLRNTATFFHSAFSHYEDYLSAPFPFGSYKQVFIAPEMTISSLSIGASMSIFSSQVLFDEKVIDQTISTRIKLAYALARQWFGVYISADGPSDEWLLDGLAEFLTDSFIKRFLGNNEARYRRYKENSAVCKADVSGASTLSCSAATDLYGTQCLGLSGKIRSWKSVAVLQMLEKQMGPESFRKILQVIILRAQDKTRSLRTLSTKEFRHFSNKVGNLERPFLKEFFPRWVGSCGCPVLRMGLSYNKRKNMIELAVFRGCTAAQNAVSVEYSNNHDSETREGDVGWPGMMSIRVYELDGMYDHPILPMSGEALQLLEIQCHSRLAAKRIQKPKKGSKLDGSDDNGDTPTADLRTNAESPLLWLRADPQMEYLAKIHFNQPIQMWINQLEKDRDVVAQAQAIATLEALPQLSFSVVNALYNFLSDSKAFWRVRIEAAFALAHTASEDTDWAGLLHLVKFYKSRRFDDTMGLPRPNDFHDFPEYFVLEAIPHAIAMVRAADKKSPREAVEFLLQLLKYNDNNGNPYSDVYWLAALVQSIGELEFGQQNKLLSSLLKRIDRLLQFERLMPSYNGILTISCIRSLTQTALKLSASIPLDRVSELIKPFRDFGTLWKVRIEASRALLDLEFQCNGIDAALILFTRYLEEEASLRGQVKLSLHAMRLCQIKGEDDIKASTLVLLLRLLEGRKAFNNVLLRHHLFCLFQILSGRPSTLYGIPRTQVQPSGETKTCSEQIKAAFLKLKISRPSKALGDAQNLLPDALPIPEDSKEALPILEDSKEALPIPEASKEADTVSNGSERKRAVLKIKVKKSAASSRAEEAEKVVVNISDGVQDEAERGGSSSMSVDAPVRMTSEPLNADCQIIEEVNSCHDRDSRITASIGSAKPVNNLDENRNELQCTADSSTVDCQPQPEDRSSPNIIKGNGVGPETQKYSSLQTLSVGRNDHGAQSLGLEDPNFCKKEKKDKKKTKDKDKKRKRDKEDHKGHRDDPEYLERKRLKKEKKRKEKEIMKLQSGNAKLSSSALQSTSFEPRGEFALQTRDLRASFVDQCTNEEPRVKPAPVELKPNEPGSSEVVSKPFETKGDGLEGSSSVRKIRLKIKDRNLNKP